MVRTRAWQSCSLRRKRPSRRLAGGARNIKYTPTKLKIRGQRIFRTLLPAASLCPQGVLASGLIGMVLQMLDQIKASIFPAMVGHAAKAVGETHAHAEDALGKALPAVLSGMMSVSKVPSGLASLFKLVNDPINDGSLLTRLSALYQGTMTAAPIYGLGAQVLQTVFGSKLPLVTQSIAALSGTKPAAAAQLVNKLTPHVLACVGDQLRKSGNNTQAGLARLLQSDEKSIAASLSPALGTILGVTPASSKVTAAWPALLVLERRGQRLRPSPKAPMLPRQQRASRQLSLHLPLHQRAQHQRATRQPAHPLPPRQQCHHHRVLQPRQARRRLRLRGPVEAAGDLGLSSPLDCWLERV
jgi:Bacterial protein of unknown function (DUF937)